MDGPRAAMEKMREILKRVLRAVAEFWERNRRYLQPLITAERGRVAREAWKKADGTARLLSRHPDLAPMDGYLDGWYPGIIRS